MGQRTQTILVVDDEAHILHVVDLKLSHAGFTVLTAEDGEEALELAQAHQPDLIITDFQMPLLNGLELCIKLRELDETRETPVIMLTARGANLDDQEIQQTHIRHMISKPFSPREVLACVEGLLNPSDQPGGVTA